MTGCNNLFLAKNLKKNELILKHTFFNTAPNRRPLFNSYVPKWKRKLRKGYGNKSNVFLQNKFLAFHSVMKAFEREIKKEREIAY